jgi:alkylation response protein AidB-like acyl-CoA dehydrogenase
MNFDFSEEQKLLQKAARDFLADRAPLSANREILESPRPYSTELWKGAAEMGWLGTAVPESYGGAGFGHLELAVIAEEVGRALAPIPFSSSVYLASEALLLAGKDDQKSRWLPKLVSGECIGSVALAEGPGEIVSARPATTFADGRVSGRKLPVADGDVAGLAVVAAREPSGAVSLVLVDLEGDGVERRSLRSVDPSRSLAVIDFKGARGELLGGSGEGRALAEHLLDRAAVLMAFEQLGGGDRALEITREYTMGRYAFGRPVASFQALKHKMADGWAALQLARSNAYWGAWALSNRSDELATAACAARISASDAFVHAAEDMVQLHGGVGYTWEFDCHLFYRRAKLLSLALGSSREWREKLISRLEAGRLAKEA